MRILWRASPIYRLKQVDLDGGVVYYDPVSINTGSFDTEIFKAYPNPLNTSQNLSLSFSSHPNTQVQVVVIDYLGKQVYSKPMITNQDGMLRPVNLAGKLQNGVYFVMGLIDNKVYQQKLMVNRN